MNINEKKLKANSKTLNSLAMFKMLNYLIKKHTDLGQLLEPQMDQTEPQDVNIACSDGHPEQITKTHLF